MARLYINGELSLPNLIMALPEHVSDEIFDRYAARNATVPEILGVQTHVGGCESCRKKLARIVSPEKALAAVHNSFAFDEFTDAPEHLPYEHLEFFVDNKLDEVTREIAQSHLAVCAECAKDLTDLRLYREIAAASDSTIADTAKKSFWSKFFAFGAIGSLAPVAAILLIAVLFGAWFLLRGNRTEEIAQGNKNQNISLPNINSVNNSPAANVSPETLPSPEVALSPVEVAPNNETLYALNDGRLTVDDKGSVKGVENLSPAAQNLIRQSLQTERISIASHSLGGSGGVLMGGSDADNGVPFGLQTPVGKIIKENQPVLRWKPLKDAASYSAAIVDDKFRVVGESEKLTATNWKPTKPLPRGANYSWQVTATFADGTETVSPSSPAPPARFRIIEQNLFDDINKLEKSGNASHLALGILYAKAGLKKEARIEFEKLVKQNPNSTLARKLLRGIK